MSILGHLPSHSARWHGSHNRINVRGSLYQAVLTNRRIAALIAIQGVEDMRFISPFALLLVAFCSAAPNCTASEQSESITPGFRFEEIDVVCVMPVVDKVQSPSSPIDTNSLRPLVILELERRGFPVEDPSCSN